MAYVMLLLEVLLLNEPRYNIFMVRLIFLPTVHPDFHRDSPNFA